MAWSDVGIIITDGTKVAGSSFTTAVAVLDGDVGSIVAIGIISDNIATTTGSTSTHTTLTDTAGNSWAKQWERTFSPGGVAADGVTYSFWIVKVTGAIVAGSTTFTFGFSASVAAKRIIVRDYAVGAGKTFQVSGTTQFGTAANSTTSPPLTNNVGSVPATSRMWLAVTALEGPGLGDTFTQDSEFVSSGGSGSSGDPADSNVVIKFSRRITSSDTTITHQATNSVARDQAGALMALDEVDEVAGGLVGPQYAGGGYY